MPLSTNPQARAKYSLPGDRETPLETRPVFLVKYMTAAERDKHSQLIEEARETADDEKCAALLLDAILIGVVDWRNVNGPDGKPATFGREAIEQILTDNEIWQLALDVPAVVGITVADRRHLQSAAPSAAAQSADSAAAANA